MNWGEGYGVEDSGFVCARGFTFLVWPKLFTRSLRVHTGNMLIPCMFSRHKTYGKLSWSRDVKRTTSLNQAHMKWFGAGVSSLTITEASARAENQTGKFIISDLLHSSQSIYRNINRSTRIIVWERLTNWPFSPCNLFVSGIPSWRYWVNCTSTSSGVALCFWIIAFPSSYMLLRAPCSEIANVEFVLQRRASSTPIGSLRNWYLESTHMEYLASGKSRWVNICKNHVKWFGIRTHAVSQSYNSNNNKTFKSQTSWGCPILKIKFQV